jgi:hypothetical protein
MPGREAAPNRTHRADSIITDFRKDQIQTHVWIRFSIKAADRVGNRRQTLNFGQTPLTSAGG